MKLLSLLTLTALLSVTACSHHGHRHSCCKKEKQCCSKEGKKEMKCDGEKCERKKSEKKEDKKV